MKLKLFNNLLRLLILVMLFTGYNRDIIDYIKSRDIVKRCSIALMVDGVKYRVINYWRSL